MTALLYWIVYHLDLGPLGPKVLDLAVKSWLRRAQAESGEPSIRRRIFGALTIFQLHPVYGTDERM
jgi:hypothetical protein